VVSGIIHNYNKLNTLDNVEQMARGVEVTARCARARTTGSERGILEPG
jgi:hypothetical protein